MKPSLPHKTCIVLIVDDNPMIRDLMCRGMESHCSVISSSDGADALLKSIDNPPDLIISDFRMPGLDGRQLYEKLRGRDSTRNIPFMFVASRGDIEEKLRPAVGGGVEDFIPKPFFVADLVRQAKKIVDRLHLEKMQKHASRPGVIQGRLEEMSVTELMQSLEMGQKTCRLTLRQSGEERNCISPRASASTLTWAAPRATRSRIRSSVGSMANLKSNSARPPTAKPPRFPPLAC